MVEPTEIEEAWDCFFREKMFEELQTHAEENSEVAGFPVEHDTLAGDAMLYRLWREEPLRQERYANNALKTIAASEFQCPRPTFRIKGLPKEMTCKLDELRSRDRAKIIRAEVTIVNVEGPMMTVTQMGWKCHDCKQYQTTRHSILGPVLPPFFCLTCPPPKEGHRHHPRFSPRKDLEVLTDVQQIMVTDKSISDAKNARPAFLYDDLVDQLVEGQVVTINAFTLAIPPPSQSLIDTSHRHMCLRVLSIE